jgi:hypothetical protein
MDFQNFLGQITQIDVSNIGIFPRDSDCDRPKVFVGCGDWISRQTENVKQRDLFLNNKVDFERFNRPFTSVTKLISAPPDGLLEGWEFWRQRPLNPGKALESINLVVEDASPDCVLAVLILLLRLADINFSDFPQSWVDAVNGWEETGNTDDPYGSWCVLASALAHRHFPMGRDIEPETARLAWNDVLRFAATCLDRRLSPVRIPTMEDSPEWCAARSALDQEKSAYLDWLVHASILQLSLPLRGSSDRRLTVDALLVTEDQFTGAAKVFYRNDRENSPLGQGFAFAAHYRPALKGTGNDFSISVDPRRGVHLRELWEELEQRETQTWLSVNARRPDGHPRDLGKLANTYDEPWFITPDLTLIGAPRKLEDGRFGSNLSWNEVRGAIWSTLNPLRNVYVCQPESNAAIPLLDLSPDKHLAGTSSGHKRLLSSTWPSGNSRVDLPRSFSRAPSIERTLAGLIKRNYDELIQLDDLPPNGTWDRIALSGGFAIVSDEGALLFDDWTSDHLPLVHMREVFEQASQLDLRLLNLEREFVRPAAEGIRKLLTKEHSFSGTSRFMRWAAKARTELAEMRGSLAIPPASADARLFRDALGRRWALDRRLEALDSEAKAVEESLRSLADLRTARIGRFIATYGFAYYVAGGVASPVARTLFHFWSRDRPETDAPGAMVLFCFTSLLIVLVLLMKFWLSYENPLRKRS